MKSLVGAWGAQSVQGYARIFQRINETWTYIQQITGSTGNATDGFGQSVSISGNTIAIGAYNMNESRASALAFIFIKNPTIANNASPWTQFQQLTNESTANSNYGLSISLSGNKLAIGSPYFIFRFRKNIYIRRTQTPDGADTALGHFLWINHYK